MPQYIHQYPNTKAKGFRTIRNFRKNIVRLGKLLVLIKRKVEYQICTTKNSKQVIHFNKYLTT
jgi:hypothetical protein